MINLHVAKNIMHIIHLSHLISWNHKDSKLKDEKEKKLSQKMFEPSLPTKESYNKLWTLFTKIRAFSDVVSQRARAWSEFIYKLIYWLHNI